MAHAQPLAALLLLAGGCVPHRRQPQVWLLLQHTQLLKLIIQVGVPLLLLLLLLGDWW